jgi:hypothetical protein
MKQVLALSNLQFNMELSFQVMTQELAIPQILGISKFPRGATQILCQDILILRRQSGAPANSGGIAQSIDSRFVETFDPVLNRAQAVPKERSNICACLPITNEQYAMKSMLEPSFTGAMNLIPNDPFGFFSITDSDSFHNGPPWSPL